ncbi:hypothetical protein P8452_30446 [Trifolium repens]|nr:hypothetical protein P8452_30446 [Trifolium repens]
MIVKVIVVEEDRRKGDGTGNCDLEKRLESGTRNWDWELKFIITYSLESWQIGSGIWRNGGRGNQELNLCCEL